MVYEVKVIIMALIYYLFPKQLYDYSPALKQPLEYPYWNGLLHDRERIRRVLLEVGSDRRSHPRCPRNRYELLIKFCIRAFDILLGYGHITIKTIKTLWFLINKVNPAV
jgi:hypothetical protein